MVCIISLLSNYPAQSTYVKLSDLDWQKLGIIIYVLNPFDIGDQAWIESNLFTSISSTAKAAYLH